MLNIREGIIRPHDQIGSLAHLHRAEIISNPTHFGGMLGGRHQGLPGRGPVFDQQAHFQ